MWTHTRESQEKITPYQALTFLKEGNQRFVNNLGLKRDYLQQVNQTSSGQYPFATILSCIDSRTSAELIFDQGLGDIFSIRIAGNIVNEDILGSMEYACSIAGSKIIVVLGHTNCGAVISACNHVEIGYLTPLLQKIREVIGMETSVTGDRTAQNEVFTKRVSYLNVQNGIRQIITKSQIIRELVAKEEILLIGAMYDLATGEVTFMAQQA